MSAAQKTVIDEASEEVRRALWCIALSRRDRGIGPSVDAVYRFAHRVEAGPTPVSRGERWWWVRGLRPYGVRWSERQAGSLRLQATAARHVNGWLPPVVDGGPVEVPVEFVPRRVIAARLAILGGSDGLAALVARDPLWPAPVRQRPRKGKPGEVQDEWGMTEVQVWATARGYQLADPRKGRAS